MDTYFPLRIRITEKEHKDYGKEFVIEENELPMGIAFMVLGTNVIKE